MRAGGSWWAERKERGAQNFSRRVTHAAARFPASSANRRAGKGLWTLHDCEGSHRSDPFAAGVLAFRWRIWHSHLSLIGPASCTPRSGAAGKHWGLTACLHVLHRAGSRWPVTSRDCFTARLPCATALGLPRESPPPAVHRRGTELCPCQSADGVEDTPQRPAPAAMGEPAFRRLASAWPADLSSVAASP
ncbi:hypothetical protein ACCO45_007779 [Purpureocillium lilacinum]|uniref:Uncharacterized protein n=1 Tax=Purpureocillium lilacinum TaxID=33203 RepID=A0ACC4DLR6_PURLI